MHGAIPVKINCYDLIPGTIFLLTVKHAVSGNPTVEPFPEGMETIMFGESCFYQK